MCMINCCAGVIRYLICVGDMFEDIVFGVLVQAELEEELEVGKICLELGQKRASYGAAVFRHLLGHLLGSVGYTMV